MDFKRIGFAQADSIGVVTLNWPEKKNALALEVLSELNAFLASMKDRRDVKVLIVRGAGKDFCAGHFLNEMVDQNINYCNAIFDTCSEVMLRLQKIPQPVIAQVQGIATAAGCQLVAACDLAVAEEGARFSTPGVKIGVFCTTPAVSIVRAIGRKRALEMLFTARFVSAREAEQWGLINRVVPADQLEAETTALARTIAEGSLLTLGIGKDAFYTQVNLADAQAYEITKRAMVNNLYAEDAVEGMKAFIGKRKPVWKDR